METTIPRSCESTRITGGGKELGRKGLTNVGRKEDVLEQGQG